MSSPHDEVPELPDEPQQPQPPIPQAPGHWVAPEQVPSSSVPPIPPPPDRGLVIGVVVGLGLAVLCIIAAGATLGNYGGGGAAFALGALFMIPVAGFIGLILLFPRGSRRVAAGIFIVLGVNLIVLLGICSTVR